MIIPIRCFTCNNVLADKYSYYLNKIKKLRGTNERFYMDGTQIPVTPEMEVMKEVGLKRACCRRIFLTHVNIMEKL
jgi:DNA-directed RNA polymerase subunit N (RpoN/RPB10)